MFALTFLGTSASVPSDGRNQSGLLVEAGSDRILIGRDGNIAHHGFGQQSDMALGAIIATELAR